MRVAPLFAGWLIAAAAGAAAAQPAPDASPPPPLPPPVVPEARDDAAWRLYHEAFGALVQGKRTRAAGLAGKLVREHAGHPAAALVAGSALEAAATGERIRKARREEPSPGASAELALFQTLHGLVFGIELCVAIECDEAGGYLGLSLAGAATGAIASLKVVEHITSGQRALLNSGTAWGAFNAMMAIIASDLDEVNREQTIALGMLGGQTVGLAAGALLFRARPTAGQVALASSGGQWAAVLAWLTLSAARTETRRTALAVSLLVSADVGLGVGAYLAQLRPDISRAQTLVIDAGGIVGAVGGGGLGVLISGTAGDRTTAGAAALGTLVGLGAAAYLTRDWGESDGGEGGGGGARAVLMPAEHGRGGLLGLGGTW